MNWVGTSNSEWAWGGGDADTLEGRGGNDWLYGAGGADLLEGQDGADTVYGGDGNDYLIGGSGNDYLNGGAHTDWADYGGAAAGVTVDMTLSGAQDTRGAGVDTLVSIEQLSGSGHADFLKGTSSANLLMGAGGDDTLAGSGGKDSLIGGAGDDVLNGQASRDYYEGGEGDDTYVANDRKDYAFEAAGAGTDLAIASITYRLPENVENLSLIGSAAIDGWGNVIDNKMTGNAGANTIYGYEGNDTLFGGGGDDILGGGDHDDLMDGGEGSDTLTFAGSSISITVDLRLTSAQDTGRGVDRLLSIENVIGSNIADTIIASAAVNRLEGAVGEDTYRFFALADLNGDTIVKAAGVGDKIDLSGIDANAALAGDQAFTLVNAFTGAAGQARYAVNGANATLQLDVNGDGASDASLTVTGFDLGVMGFVL